MARFSTRRDALRTGVALAGTALAGCVGARTTDTVLDESFESGLEGWETDASIGPEEPISAFEWHVRRSREQAAEGTWSLEVFTEGDHDDGTAWAVTQVSPPPDATSFEASVQAWSLSESFNMLRNLVMYLGPERPTDEGSFPDPGMNSSDVAGAPFGGLREPLHLAEGWREYVFEWRPDAVPDTLFFAVGVSVVWEADATHYVDAVEITAE